MSGKHAATRCRCRVACTSATWKELYDSVVEVRPVPVGVCRHSQTNALPIVVKTAAHTEREPSVMSKNLCNVTEPPTPLSNVWHITPNKVLLQARLRPPCPNTCVSSLKSCPNSCSCFCREDRNTYPNYSKTFSSCTCSGRSSPRLANDPR